LNSNKNFKNNTKYQPYLNNLLLKLSENPIYNKNSITFFHREVLALLIELDVDYQAENRDNFISKDILIKDKNLCIELQGKHHFYRDNTKNYQTIFSNIILAQNGYKVEEISIFDWQKNAKEGKLLYLNNLIKKV
jgi:hypothetical protein